MPGPVGMVVVGYGYWGPNLVRNAVECPDLRLVAVCERDPERAAEFSRRYPGVPVVGDLDEALRNPAVEAVAVATPPATHYALVRRALQAGRHALVEKPMATTVADAEDLVALAAERSLTLMAGHTFIYSPAVAKVRELIRNGDLGEIYFVTSSRMNLGLYQRDGVICDLAPHDASIFIDWFDAPVNRVTATGRGVFQHAVPETSFITLCFEGGATANIQISWLAPRKVRHMVVVGSRRMVLYDDTASDDPVRVYDRGLDFFKPDNFGEYQLTYRSGDMVAPRLAPVEPLSLELEDFADAVRTGRTPRSSAALGLEVVRVLEAATTSLARGGMPVTITRTDDRRPSTTRIEPNRNANGTRQDGAATVSR